MKNVHAAAGEALINGSAIPDGGNDGNNELVAVPSPYPLYRRNSGARLHNKGASGAVTFTLPTDATLGERFFVSNIAAQNIILDPGTNGTIQVGATAGTAGQRASCATGGADLELICVGAGPAWYAVLGKTGSWALA